MGRFKNAIIAIERGRRNILRNIDKFNEREESPYDFKKRKRRTIFDDEEEEDVEA